MYTFSEALYIMDHNTERLMVSELQDAVNELRDKVSGLQAERNTIQTERDVVQIERDTMQLERDVFRLRLKGKAYEEISAELSISFDSVKKILESKP
ncbi:hypothetical protein IMSAGC005_01208 [Lachnospiraceae bacterium]|nr:hypothetical protein IMSAGC005_01208 [Lachnospiraceae bacterium]